MATNSNNNKKEDQNSSAVRSEVVLRFENASFGFGHNHPILTDTSFSLRRGMKVSIMGQNGAGKSTIFKLIIGELKLDEGEVENGRGLTVALSRQVILPAERELTVREFFEKCFDHKVYDIDPKINGALEVVNLHAPHDRLVKSFSGGQQARLLLASAIIQNADLLLLDEPTNNLDAAGIAHLTKFLQQYDKTCIVISHDAEFLNSFIGGVLYLDVRTQKVEQYAGNYFDVLRDIEARIEKENRLNAQLAKKIQENKDKANFFANKGGRMRLLAKRMREEAEELEEEKVDVRREDKTIRNFVIPAQPEFTAEIMHISSFTTMSPITHKPVKRVANISLKRKQHLLLCGPNGIGKTTLLEALANGTTDGTTIAEGVRVGYYRQDFSTLDFESTVFDALLKVMDRPSEESMRATASGFLISGNLMHKKIGMLSEGQKGLVAFAQLVLLRPGLLIFDEPTNHINFRHLPVIAKALDQYEGAMILVSHVPEFLAQIRIDDVLDLEK